MCFLTGPDCGSCRIIGGIMGATVDPVQCADNRHFPAKVRQPFFSQLAAFSQMKPVNFV